MKKSNGFQVLKNGLIKSKVFLIILLLSTGLAITTENFLTTGNLLNVLRQVTVNTIVAAGFTLILGSGLIDLSIGMLLGFSGFLLAKMMVAGVPIWVAIIITILFAMASGVISASLITFFDLPPFVVTLAMQQVYKGLMYIISKMAPVTNLPESFVVIGQGYVGEVPIPIFVMIGVITIMYFVINKTTFGRNALAMGSNPAAARVSGINIFLTRVMVFAMGGFCAAVGAIVQTARTASAQIGAGNGMEMDAIAAVVIGGTSMIGGAGNVIGTFWGCLVIGIVNNGMNLLGIDSNWQIAVKGIMILVAVLLDNFSTNYYMKRAKKQMLQ